MHHVNKACHDDGVNSKMAPTAFFESRTATISAPMCSSTQLLLGVHRLDRTHRLRLGSSEDSRVIVSCMINTSRLEGLSPLNPAHIWALNAMLRLRSSRLIWDGD